MKYKHFQGFIALTAVLVLSAVFLSVSITLVTHALSGSDQVLRAYFRAKSEAVSLGCVEYALFKTRESFNYAGGESILVGEETCTILPIEGVLESSRTIQTVSTVSGHTYRNEVIIEASSLEILVSSSKTVPNF
jgi:hypothetical protein